MEQVQMVNTVPFAECTPANVRAVCEDMGFSLDDAALAPLVGYLSLVMKWNRVMNLVGPTMWEDILRILVVDSFHLASFIAELSLPEHPECWDLGSGAGLPGIPLRMLWQKGDYTLVEVREKRALFLQTVLAPGALATSGLQGGVQGTLPGVRVFRGRAEEFMAGRSPANLIVSRAFMPWEKMLALVQDHVASGGFCVFLTLAPAPQLEGTGWTVAAQKQYAVMRDTRYFWALRRD